eukprot:1948643-Pyramimonas_sp.AAC.1
MLRLRTWGGTLDSISGDRWVAVVFRHLIFVSAYLPHRESEFGDNGEPRGSAEGHYASFAKYTSVLSDLTSK